MAELTTKLSAVGAASSESAATTATVHEVEHIKGEIAFAVAGAPAPPPLAPDAILQTLRPRALDPAKLRLKATRPIERDVAQKFVKSLTDEAGLREDQWQLLQPRPLAKHKVPLQCVGEPRAAARRVAPLLGARRGPDGEWRKFQVVDTLGHSAVV